MEKLHKGDNILLIAQLLLTKEKYDEVKKIPCVASIGKTSRKVRDMGKERRRDLGRLVGPSIDALLLKVKLVSLIQLVS